MRFVLASHRTLLLAALAGLPSASPSTPSSPPATWTTLYQPPGPSVDGLYVLQEGADLVVYVTGPAAEIVRCSTDGGGAVRPDFPPVHAASARYFVSDGANRLGRALYTPGPEGVQTSFQLYHGEGDVVLQLSLPRHASFQISDDGSTVAALQTREAPSSPDTLTVHDSSGAARRFSWAGDRPHGSVLGLRLTRDGRRLALHTKHHLAVYDCSTDADQQALYELELPGAFDLSPDAQLLAIRQAQGVVFLRDGHEIQRVPTPTVPLQVAFGPGGLAVVLEAGALQLVDLDAQQVLWRHVAPAGSEFRSVDLRPLDVSRGLRIALGLRSGAPPEWLGGMQVLTWQSGEPLAVENWPRFAFSKLNWRSPQVRFVPDGGRVLVSTRDRVLLSSEVR